MCFSCAEVVAATAIVAYPLVPTVWERVWNIVRPFRRIAFMFAVVAMSSCAFVQRIDKECRAYDNHEVCLCRDMSNGRFAECPK